MSEDPCSRAVRCRLRVRLPGVEYWHGVAGAYHRSFATLCAGTIPALLDGLPRGRLLDVGCGTGELLAEARRVGIAAFGIDAASDMVSRAAGVAHGDVLRASLPDTPFCEESFDAVTANFVVNHVDDPRAVMRELTRVTMRGGTVVATI